MSTCTSTWAVPSGVLVGVGDVGADDSGQGGVAFGRSE